MDALFHVIDGAQAVLCSRGVYRQVPLFRREDRIYAKWGAGFVRLGSGSGTSVPHVSRRSIDGLPAFAPTEVPRLLT
jgi:hypothetical protein